MLRHANAVLLALSVAACVPVADKPGQTGPAREPTLAFKRSSFSALEGWGEGAFLAAHGAYLRSCRSLAVRLPSSPLGGDKAYGTVADWQEACRAAGAQPVKTDGEARAFFESGFGVVQALNGEVDLGQFRPHLKGERVAGRVEGGRLVPFAARREIVSQAAGSAATPLVFVDDAVGAFFLHIQGSGRIKLDTGESIRAAYDGQNGHAYTAIGRVLVDRGEIQREALSMQSIRAWLVANPEKADALMSENASYVFFKEVPLGDPSVGANGAQGVPLTPEASLAVDLRFHALGVPMWVDGRSPAENADADDVDLRRLFIAQDTGGAIRGPIRGDVYWGAGARAESIAGRMAHKGRLHVLLPKALVSKLD